MSSTIQYKHVMSLLIMELAIIISWVAYHEYQPLLINQFKLTEFAFPMLILQGIILSLTPILAGYISDKMKNKNGKLIPVVNFGISATAMIFMSVAITIFSEPEGILRLILPLLIVLWLISMNIFRSPAISLIEYFVPQNEIPKIYAYFVILASVGYALEPLIIDLVQFFGSTITFIVGGVLIFGTGKLVLSKSALINPNNLSSEFNNDTIDGKSNFVAVIVVSLLFGLITSIIFKILPSVFDANFELIKGTALNGKELSSGIVVISALFTLLISKLVKNELINKMLILGAILAFFSFLILFNSSSTLLILIAIILIILSYSIVSLYALPFSLYKLSTKSTVLGIGIFFGMIEMVDSIVEIWKAI